MDVVLFNPATKKGCDSNLRLETPLSLLFVATPLDRRGYRVNQLNGRFPIEAKAHKILLRLMQKNGARICHLILPAIRKALGPIRQNHRGRE